MVLGELLAYVGEVHREAARLGEVDHGVRLLQVVEGDIARGRVHGVGAGRVGDVDALLGEDGVVHEDVDNLDEKQVADALLLADVGRQVGQGVDVGPTQAVLVCLERLHEILQLVRFLTEPGIVAPIGALQEEGQDRRFLGVLLQLVTFVSLRLQEAAVPRVAQHVAKGLLAGVVAHLDPLLLARPGRRDDAD